MIRLQPCLQYLKPEKQWGLNSPPCTPPQESEKLGQEQCGISFT